MDKQVTKEMTIGEVLNMHRGTARIFMEFGMGCLGCPHAQGESVADAGAAHGVNVDELVDQLNVFLADAK